MARGRPLWSALVRSLSQAVSTLDYYDVDLDARWGDVQVAIRNGRRIAIHGGHADAGVYGAISPSLRQGGYRPRRGNSYIVAVTWDDACPVADAVLLSSQTSDPASPHYADQTELYSRKQWVRFPLCEHQIEAARIGETLAIFE